MTDEGHPGARERTDRRGGRPALSSRHAIADAAAELFLEMGYDRVSADMIARRVGLSRSALFTYVSSKSDALWVDIDDALDAAERLEHADEAAVLDALLDHLASSGIPPALTHAAAMGTSAAIAETRAGRLERVARLLLRARGPAPAEEFAARIRAVRADAAATAILGAVVAWAQAGPRRRSVRDYVGAALAPEPA